MPRVNPVVLCVRCNEKYTSRADQTCRFCKRFDWTDIPDEIWHQFIGLFLGEGCVTIRLVPQPGGRENPSCSLAIALREDDRAILDLLQSYFGGSCGTDNHGVNPQVRWVIQRHVDILAILERLIIDCKLPGKKLHDVEICIEFIKWRSSLPLHGVDYTYGLGLRKKLQDTRKYNAIRG